MDIEKICKLLMLSQSPNDSEALSAVRKAHQIIKKSNKSWQDVILNNIEKKESNTSGGFTEDTDFWGHKKWWYSLFDSRKDEILEFLVEHGEPKFRPMLINIRNFWLKKIQLSEKQIRAVHINAMKFGVD